MARFAYYEEGYRDTRVPSEIVRGDTVDVSLQIFEGQPWTIRRVDIANTKRVRRSSVARSSFAWRRLSTRSSSESQRRGYFITGDAITGYKFAKGSGWLI